MNWKKVSSLLVISLMLLSVFTVAAVGKKDDKVTICHVPANDPTKEVTLTLSEEALKAHMDSNGVMHELDYFGECIGKYIAQCNDGYDNDEDGLIDYPDDPGCTDPTDTDETDTSLGYNSCRVVDDNCAVDGIFTVDFGPSGLQDGELVLVDGNTPILVGIDGMQYTYRCELLDRWTGAPVLNMNLDSVGTVWTEEDLAYPGDGELIRACGTISYPQTAGESTMCSIYFTSTPLLPLARVPGEPMGIPVGIGGPGAPGGVNGANPGCGGNGDQPGPFGIQFRVDPFVGPDGNVVPGQSYTGVYTPGPDPNEGEVVIPPDVASGIPDGAEGSIVGQGPTGETTPAARIRIGERQVPRDLENSIQYLYTIGELPRIEYHNVIGGEFQPTDVTPEFIRYTATGVIDTSSIEVTTPSDMIASYDIVSPNELVVYFSDATDTPGIATVSFDYVETSHDEICAGDVDVYTSSVISEFNLYNNIGGETKTGTNVECNPQGNGGSEFRINPGNQQGAIIYRNSDSMPVNYQLGVNADFAGEFKAGDQLIVQTYSPMGGISLDPASLFVSGSVASSVDCSVFSGTITCNVIADDVGNVYIGGQSGQYINPDDVCEPYAEGVEVGFTEAVRPAGEPPEVIFPIGNKGIGINCNPQNIDNLAAQVEQNTIDISGLYAENDAQDVQIGSLTENIFTIGEDVNTLFELNDGQQVQIDNLIFQLSTMPDFAALAAQVDQNSNDIFNLQNDLLNVETQVTTNENNIFNLQNDVSSLSGEIYTIFNTLDNHELRITNLENTFVTESDLDGDGLENDLDNCPFIYNPDQADFDGDYIGDFCDGDWNGDGIFDSADLYTIVMNLDDRVTANELNIITNTNEITNLYTLNDGQQVQINELYTLVSDIPDITALESQVALNVVNIAQNANEITTIENELIILGDTVTGIAANDANQDALLVNINAGQVLQNARLDDLEAEDVAQNNDITNINNNLNVINNDLTNINNNLFEINTNIDNIFVNLNDLDNRVTALEGVMFTESDSDGDGIPDAVEAFEYLDFNADGTAGDVDGLTIVFDPVAGTDAVNKDYVDNEVNIVQQQVNQNSNDINVINNEVTNLYTLNDNQQLQIDDLIFQLSTVPDFTALQAQVAQNANNIAQNTYEIENIWVATDEVGLAVNGLESRVTQNEIDIDNQQIQIDDLIFQLSNIPDITELEARVAQNEFNIVSNANEITTIENELIILGDTVTNLEANDANQDALLVNIQAGQVLQNARLDDLEAEDVAQNNDITNINNNLFEINNDITNINNDLFTINGDIDNINIVNANQQIQIDQNTADIEELFAAQGGGGGGGAVITIDGITANANNDVIFGTGMHTVTFTVSGLEPGTYYTGTLPGTIVMAQPQPDRVTAGPAGNAVFTFNVYVDNMGCVADDYSSLELNVANGNEVVAQYVQSVVTTCSGSPPTTTTTMPITPNAFISNVPSSFSPATEFTLEIGHDGAGLDDVALEVPSFVSIVGAGADCEIQTGFYNVVICPIASGATEVITLVADSCVEPYPLFAAYMFNYPTPIRDIVEIPCNDMVSNPVLIVPPTVTDGPEDYVVTIGDSSDFITDRVVAYDVPVGGEIVYAPPGCTLLNLQQVECDITPSVKTYDITITFNTCPGSDHIVGVSEGGFFLDGMVATSACIASSCNNNGICEAGEDPITCGDCVVPEMTVTTYANGILVGPFDVITLPSLIDSTISGTLPPGQYDLLYYVSEGVTLTTGADLDPRCSPMIDDFGDQYGVYCDVEVGEDIFFFEVPVVSAGEDPVEVEVSFNIVTEIFPAGSMTPILTDVQTHPTS